MQNLGIALAKGSLPWKQGIMRQRRIGGMCEKPLMPTRRHGKAGRLLEDGKAKAAKLEPSAIQLLYDILLFI
jgi:hypothetical protein